ncbi:MAG: hypothetical protein ACTIJ6_05300 [Leucobacter sp.]
MANRNGPIQNRGRIEWSWTAPTVSQSTTSINIPVYAYFRQISPYSQYHNGTKSWSGAWGSGSAGQAFNLEANGRVVLVEGGSGSVALTDSTQTRSFTVSTNHFYGTTSDTLSVSFPARYAVTPSLLMVTRLSDTSHRLNWNRNSLYTAVVVQRRTNGGSWVQVGRPTGNAATWTDTTTQANKRYEYRVAGVGGSGQSAFTGASASVYTTPAAVSSVLAEKVGTYIQVTATGLPPYATAYEVSDNGSLVDSNVTSWPWLHSAPNPSITHTYSVVAKRGTLKSAGTTSNTVQLLAPPLAPTGLTPNGGVSASDMDVLFAWVHNPVDTSAQTAYELRYRVPAGAWTTLSGTTAATRTVALTEGAYEWQVRTKGQHASFGDWSAIATVTVITRPGVAIQGDGTTDTPIYTVEWTWDQAQGRPQSAWQVELYDSEMVLLQRREGSGAATAASLSYRLVDGESYTVQVRAATGGIWSEWSPLEITAEFVPPADALVTGGWSETTGTVELEITEGAGVVVADLLSIERSVDGGDTWESFITNAVLETTLAFSDGESLSRGTTLYRVTATYSVNGAASTVEYAVVADSGSVWLSGGVGFSITARLPFSPQPEIEPGRARSVEEYDGRSKPVAYAGEQTSYGYSVSGLLADTDVELSALVEDMTILAQHAEPVFMVRDPDSRRIYGVISSIPMPRQNGLGWWAYSFSLTETDR